MNKTYRMSAVAAVFAMAMNAQAGEGCGAKKSASACGHERADAPEVTQHTTAAVKQLVDSGQPVTLIDARTAKWYDGQVIEGAQWIPADATEEQIAQALPSKDARIVTYCSNLKCSASGKLAHRLIDLGYTNVEKYPEGLEGWTQAGHPVEQSSTAAASPESAPQS